MNIESYFRGIKTLSLIFVCAAFIRADWVANPITEADYLVISHSDFDDSVWKNNLLSILEGRGFSAGLIFINEGQASDDVQYYINQAYNTGIHAKYVMLIGAGKNLPASESDPWIYQYRGIPNHTAQASEGNFIPFLYESRLAYSRDTDIPNDYGYLSGLTSYGDIVIGRIPAQTIAEIRLWVDKLSDYYSSILEFGSWKNKELLISYNVDNAHCNCPGWHVDWITDSVRSYIPQNITINVLNGNEIDPEHSLQHSVVRDTAFENSLARGTALIHAASTSASPDALVCFYYDRGISSYNFENVNKYPILFANSCDLGEITRPEMNNVTRELMFVENGGIIGSYSPSVETGQWLCKVLGSYFHKILYEDKIVTFGLLAERVRILSELNIDERYWWQGRAMVVYGDPSMPIAINQNKDSDIVDNTTWQGSIIVENDINIQTGATLTIKPGTGIFFNSNAKLRVYGTLIAEGTPEFPIKFSAASTSPSMSDWDGITFETGSVGSILSYCEIKYAQTGITLYESNVNIENNWIENNYNGIYSEGILSPYIYNNRISNNYYFGVAFEWGCAPDFFNNTFELNRYGAYFNGYTHPDFGPTSGRGKGYNRLIDNGRDGIYATYYSDPFLGSSDSYGRIGGYNSLYNNQKYNATACIGTHIEAEYNFWAGEHGVIYTYSGSSIDNYPRLSSNPGGGSSLPKMLGPDMDMSQDIDDNYSEYNPLAPDTSKLTHIWPWANELYMTDQFVEALDIYKMIVRKFPGSQEARSALVKIFHVSGLINDQTLIGYLQANRRDTKLNESIGQISTDLLGLTYIKTRDFKRAVETFELTIKQFPGTVSEQMALTELVNLYCSPQFMDKGKASEYLSVLKEKYPNQLSTLMAQRHIGEKVDWSKLNDDEIIPGGGEVRSKVEIEQQPAEYALGDNYPNPFNPVTSIPYDLPEEGNVSLVIYNIMGQEIIHLVNGFMPAGRHNVLWNGKDDNGQIASTGIYFYRLESGGFTKIKRMVLIK